MTVMLEIDAALVPDEQIAALEDFAAALGPSELRDLLQALTASVKNGSDVTLLESDAELTPSQAAAQLKMSRTFLYKLLDRGELVSHNVGRDRRIRTTDLARFEASRQRDRRELAERFAHAEKTRRGAAEELLGDI